MYNNFYIHVFVLISASGGKLDLECHQLGHLEAKIPTRTLLQSGSGSSGGGAGMSGMNY